jgi:hypothetical protein
MRQQWRKLFFSSGIVWGCEVTEERDGETQFKLPILDVGSDFLASTSRR